MKKLNDATPLTAERFVAQVGIISIQSRIEEDSPLNRRWTVRSEVGDTVYTVDGYAGDFGRPRGADTDILMALETLFLFQGCPANNTVTTTAYEIVQMVYQNTSGVLYKRLRESLLRLWRVGFMVALGDVPADSTWGRFSNTSLSLISSIQFWTQGKRHDSPELHDLEAHGKLVIQLSEPLAASIRAGYYQNLDRKLLMDCKQPVARALYRMLQAHRPADDTLTCRVADWGARCGIINTDPRKIRRTLESAHKELQTLGYLAGVAYTGQGTHQEITYRFTPVETAPALPPPDAEALRLLLEVRVVRDRAGEAARDYPLEQIQRAVAYVKSRKNLRSSGGLALDILRNPDKYELPDVMPIRSAEEVKQAAQKATQVLEANHDAEFQAHQATLLALDPVSQWDGSKATIRFLAKGVLSEAGFEQLEGQCRAGQISAVEFSRQLVARTQKADLKAYLLAFAEEHGLATIEAARRVAQGRPKG